VRIDWFIATAARPPLYHTILGIPKNARDLERRLRVDVAHNFNNNRLVRAGFTESGVSRQNRMVERHPALYGAYWKSYDFKSSDGPGNLIKFPLGPLFKDNPYPQQAFKQAGGEIIFNLPNGLQGYMLIDDKDNRIDAGPTEIVRDKEETSGSPAVVNGLSCMYCHKHGMISEFKDVIRAGHGVGGRAALKVEQLYPPQPEMEKWLKKDEDRFLRALDEAIGPYFRVGADKNRDVRDFPEPVGPLARLYINKEISLAEAAAELGLKDPKLLQGAIRANQALRQQLGLGPLMNDDGTIKREAWETLRHFTSPFQELARCLDLGTPLRVQ
jgi:serine/threonine-protein kinase